MERCHPDMYDIPSDPTIVKAVITRSCVEGKDQLPHGTRKITIL